MIINDLDGYYIVFDTKNWNTELDTLPYKTLLIIYKLKNITKEIFTSLNWNLTIS